MKRGGREDERWRVEEKRIDEVGRQGGERKKKRRKKGRKNSGEKKGKR